jgi:hypothetical protein
VPGAARDLGGGHADLQPATRPRAAGRRAAGRAGRLTGLGGEARPYRLRWLRSIWTRIGGIGMDRVSCWGAVVEAAGLAGGAVVGPVLAGPGSGGGQVDTASAAAREPAVGQFQHDGFGGAQITVAGVPVAARGRTAGAETRTVRNVDRRRNRRPTRAVGTYRDRARPACHPIILRQSDDALTGDHRLPNRRSSRLMASVQYRCDGADQGLIRSAAPGP